MVLYNPTAKEMLTTHWGKEACIIYFRTDSEAERTFGAHVTGYFICDDAELETILLRPDTIPSDSVLKFAMNASANHGSSNHSFTQLSFRAQDVSVLESGV